MPKSSALAHRIMIAISIVGSTIAATFSLACLLACPGIVGYAIADDSTVRAESAEADLSSTAVTATRISGSDRYETCAAEATAGWTSSEWAIVTTGENWPDALCVSGLAGALDAPILMVKKDEVPNSISSAISSLGIQHIIVIGGTSSVSEEVVNSLEDLGTAVEQRLGGASRYDTAQLIYAYGQSNGYWESSDCIIASGNSFPDALSISPYAFKSKAPVMLASNGSLGSQELTIALSYERQIVCGGNQAISDQTFALLSNPTRLGGANRYETSALIYEFSVSTSSMLSASDTAYASGKNYPDALAGGALQGHRGSALVVTTAGNEAVSASKITETTESTTSIIILGGEVPMPTSSVETLRVLYGDTSIAEEAIAAYAEVISQYRAALATNPTSSQWISLSGGLRAGGQYEYVAVDNWIGTPSVYAYADLDSDGISELIISTSSSANSVLNVWDYTGGKLSLPICSVYRFYYSLCEDGYVTASGSSGAAAFYYGQYAYSSSTLVPIKQLECNCDASTGIGEVTIAYDGGTAQVVGSTVQEGLQLRQSIEDEHSTLSGISWQTL